MTDLLKPGKMSITVIFLLLLIGLAAGMLSGMVGVGGGILIVPGLVYFLGYSQKLAQGTSLGILLLPVGVLAAFQFYQKGFIDVKAVLIVAVAFLVGGYFGSKITLMLPQETVRKLFAVVMLLISLQMLFFHKESRTNDSKAGLENKK